MPERPASPVRRMQVVREERCAAPTGAVKFRAEAEAVVRWTETALWASVVSPDSARQIAEAEAIVRWTETAPWASAAS